ncbi:MAG: HlyD family secretion protein [Cyclonatronaceae bacterium]
MPDFPARSSSSLKPVPIPWKLRWREFRIRILPIIVFLLALLAILWLWSKRVQAPDFVGRVMAPSAVITAPADGELRDIFTQNFDDIAARDTLFRLQRGPEGEFRARIARIEAEINYMRTSLYPAGNITRNQLDYQNLRLDWMEKRAQKAIREVELQQLQRDYRRAARLEEQNVLQPQIAERAKTALDAARSEVQQLETIIEELAGRLADIRRQYPFSAQSGQHSLEAAIRTQMAEIRLIEAELGSLYVSTPQAGRVQQMRRSEQEYVRRGDTLAVVQARQPEYILGHLRQPFSVTPEPGMMVEIRSRSIQRNRYEAPINSIGGQIQPISADMQRPGMNTESGLPVKIVLEPGLADRFTPGEIVDLILRPE